MIVLHGLSTAQSVAAFFFFSWISQLLWNGIVVDQLALVSVKVTYWQAAALWFLVSILLAWTGLARRPRSLALNLPWFSLGKFARAVKREIRSCVGEWVRDELDESDRSDLGD